MSSRFDNPPEIIYFVKRENPKPKPYYGRSDTRLFRTKNGIKDFINGMPYKIWKVKIDSWEEIECLDDL